MNSQPDMARTLLASLLLLAGCAAPKQDSKTIFAQAVTLHEQRQYDQAADSYERVLKSCEPNLCAQALRSLGNVRAAQGNLDEAVKLYRQVGEKYPQQDWEVLQAWKSAGDLLWDAGRKDEARQFYRQIVARFDKPDMPAVIQTIVRASQTRLAA
jgi:tetratricopeptide (TPR) repeat protein